MASASSAGVVTTRNAACGKPCACRKVFSRSRCWQISSAGQRGCTGQNRSTVRSAAGGMFSNSKLATSSPRANASSAAGSSNCARDDLLANGRGGAARRRDRTREPVAHAPGGEGGHAGELAAAEQAELGAGRNHEGRSTKAEGRSRQSRRSLQAANSRFLASRFYLLPSLLLPSMYSPCSPPSFPRRTSSPRTRSACCRWSRNCSSQRRCSASWRRSCFSWPRATASHPVAPRLGEPDGVICLVAGLAYWFIRFYYHDMLQRWSARTTDPVRAAQHRARRLLRHRPVPLHGLGRHHAAAAAQDGAHAQGQAARDLRAGSRCCSARISG